MKLKNYKSGMCIKKSVRKCKDIAKIYNKIQNSFIGILENDIEVLEYECNVDIGTFEGKVYTTDFLCKKVNGEYFVRECIFRKKLSQPRNAKMLDFSRNYWFRKGITDWAIVVEKEENNEEE